MRRVWEGVWEAKNCFFDSFFDQKSKAKKHDVVEGPKESSRRRKKRSPEDLREFGGDQVEVVLSQVACWGGRGGITKNQHAGYLTRHWAVGPANFRFSNCC